MKLLNLFKKDNFIKDVIILLLVGIVGTALFSTGFAMATDKYFAKAVTGIIGEFGEYDLLFQGKVELKTALARQIKETLAKHFPGATLKPGISVAGQTTYFVGLPDKYKTKAVYNSLDDYFADLPGNGGFSIMTEPRLTITSVPKALFDRISSEVEQISGISFTFKDGSNIGVILNNSRVSETVQTKIEKVLGKYQILEVRLGTTDVAANELISLGKQVSSALRGFEGIDYATDVTAANGNTDYEYLMGTLSEVKKFLLAYASEVKIVPAEGANLEIGDLLALNGNNQNELKSGAVLDPLSVVVKVTAVEGQEVQGLIIQGDAEYLKDNTAYELISGDKVGSIAGTVEVSSRKSQLIYAMDQGIKILDKLDGAVKDFNASTDGPGITVNSIESAYDQIVEVQQSLGLIESGVEGLSGKANTESLVKMAETINGVGDDLDYLAQNFGRVQILESRFEEALNGLNTAQLFLDSPLVESSLSNAGGIYDKLMFVNEQIKTVESSLQTRVQQLDNFINNFNPLVTVLLSWRDKARDFADAANSFGAVFTPGSENQQQMEALIQSTDEVLSSITGFNGGDFKQGLEIVSERFFGGDQVDLTALISELERVKESLPNLLDEEIGNTVTLIEKYAGNEDSGAGDKLQIFTESKVDRSLTDAAIKDIVGKSDIEIYSLPAGTIQLDVRGELYKILAEVRSTIAALVVVILWVLSLILDHSLIISMIKQLGFTILPEKLPFTIPLLERGYRLARKIFSPANLYAFFIGGLWLTFAFIIAGAQVPYLNYWQIGICGGVMGIFISMLAEKINPVNKEELMAGLSLGFSFVIIMREIIIPSGRPGLLQLLNRRKMKL